MSSILLVDDSRFARKTMRAAVEKLGYTADEATSGIEALERYSLRHHEVVTLDLVMPGMQGLDVIARLRELNPEVKIVVVTADIQESTRSQAKQIGAAAVINKPVDPRLLETTLAGLLKGERACP